MKQRPTNLWLVVALGIFVVGFCFYKLATVGGKTNSNDLPARAFVAEGAPTIVSADFLTKSRIPLGSYLAASRVSLGLSRQLLGGSGLRFGSLVAAGMSRSQARSLVRETKQVTRAWGGYRYERRTGFELKTVAGATAVFAAPVVFVSRSSGALISANVTTAFQTRDGWAHFHLTSVSLTTG